MINTLFKNAISKKVFKGNYYIKFEKMPYYTRGGSGGSDRLVKDYNLGFTKLAVRCKNSKVDASKLMELAGLPGYPNIDELAKSYLDTQQNLWRLYMNSMTPIGHGLAELVDSVHLDEPYRKVLGYYGYTHRGGQTFKIGDRLFDERYEPKEEDYPEWQWAGWQEKFNKAWDEGDDFDREMIYNEGVKSVIPFKMRGPKVIETLEEAKQAAKNMSSYLG